MNDQKLLVGKLQFAWHLTSAHQQKKAGQKRPRQAVNDGTNDWAGWVFEETTSTTTTTTHGGLLTSNKNHDSYSSNSSCSSCMDENTKSRRYLVSLPASLLRQALEACCDDSLLVQIEHYNLIRCTIRTQSHEPFSGLIEVKLKGMTLLSTTQSKATATEATTTASKSSSSSYSSDSIWTWKQLKRLEAVHAKYPHLQCSLSNQAVSFHAVVSAISPVLAMQPTDPFCLMELMDPESSASSASSGDDNDNDDVDEHFTKNLMIVVIRKTALALSACLKPGDCILLQNVTRQAWKVPQTLSAARTNANAYSHHHLMVPTHVFSLSDLHQIDWYNQQSVTSLSYNQAVPVDAVFAFLRTMIQARILQVHYSSSSAGQQQHNIHSLDLELCSNKKDDDDDNNNNDDDNDDDVPTVRHCLFVTYFPMSTSLMASLRPGAILQAYNLHAMDDNKTWCACLRSTLTLIKAAPPMSSETSSLDLLTHLPPWIYHGKIRQTYWELALYQLVVDYLEASRVMLNYDKSTLPEPVAWVQSIKKILNLSDILPRKIARNAYAEFLDQGYAPPKEDSEDLSLSLGCHVSRLEPKVKLPALVDLSKIHQALVGCWKERLKNYVSKSERNKVYIGLTGSFSLTKLELLRLLSLYALKTVEDRRGYHLLTSGRVSLMQQRLKATSGVTPTSCGLSNGHTFLPCNIAISSASCLQVGLEDNDTVIGSISSATLSYLCLGSLGMSDSANPSKRIIYLPPYGESKNGQKAGSLRGPCVLIEIGGYVFAGAMYLELEKVNCVGRVDERIDGGGGQRIPALTETMNLPSIGDCLMPGFNSNNEYSALMAIVVRKHFNAYKVKNGSYRGFVVTLAHAPKVITDMPPRIPDGLSSLQAMEWKIEIPIDSIQMYHLQKMSRRSWTEDQLGMALAWWRIASSDMHCALLGGGWDELCAEPSPESLSKATIMQLSTSVLQPDEKRGYVRLRGSIGHMSALSTYVTLSPDHETLPVSTAIFDFVGGTKIFPGELDRRPRRRRYGNIVYGEILDSMTCAAGVPICRIADINRAMCQDLRENSRWAVAPSLVREIRGAVFLGISYCRALAECTKCFSALEKLKDSSHESKKNGSEQTKGCITNAELDDMATDNRPSFWHIPLTVDEAKNGLSIAMETDLSQKIANPYKASATKAIANRKQKENEEFITDTSTSKREQNRQNCPLACPKKCDVRRYGGIKWECSGTLDDGTGQAQLYAERDVALLLLGIKMECLEAIEEGAWLVPDGIIFKKTMPVPSHTRHAVQTARSLAASRNKGRRLKEELVLQFFTPSTRADYLMQRHCRLSREPTRDLNYFVRAKPLSDEIRHVNHTEITLVPKREVPTYSLPPVKLNLVDCAARSARGRSYDK